MSTPQTRHGAFLVSLDFELRWGVRDTIPADGPYRRNLEGVRSVIPKLLDLFAKYEIAATWATVGLLFARNNQERLSLLPTCRPGYQNPALDPYCEPVGEDETKDPLHYAGSLIERIRSYPRQEIGSHTFSHFYCLERGASAAAFRADLESAIAAARRRNIRLESIVFPCNQHNPAWDGILLDLGVRNYRATIGHPIYAAGENKRQRTPLRRALRLADQYVNITGANLARWDDIPQPNGLFRIPGTYHLRPFSPRLASFDRLRLDRVTAMISQAARERSLFHMCWHPHSIGTYQTENLHFLTQVLEVYAHCRDRYGMRSLNMRETAQACDVRTQDVSGRQLARPSHA